MQVFGLISSGEREAEARAREGERVLEGGPYMKTFIRMLQDESGASAAEYALILAIIGGAIALAALALGTAVSDSMTRAKDCINDPNTCAGSSGTGGTGGTGT
jgi:pilus assembly protein Flp/PilA